MQTTVARRSGSWVIAGGMLFLLILGMGILASPVVSLLGDSANAFPSAMRGLMGFLIIIAATISPPRSGCTRAPASTAATKPIASRGSGRRGRRSGSPPACPTSRCAAGRPSC